MGVVLTVVCSAARHRCHSRWANVTGCEKGRSLSRSVIRCYLLFQRHNRFGSVLFTFDWMGIVGTDIKCGDSGEKGKCE